MTTETPIYAMSAQQIADHLLITPRRVTQYRDEGKLPTIERGKFDFAWILHLRTGEKFTANQFSKPPRNVLVALGWLAAIGPPPGTEETEALVNLFERNGMARDAALIALGRAQGIYKS